MTSQQSRIISRVLSPAVGLWLRSQVSQVEDLQVNIQGGDRQILSGYIPHIFLSARHAVYQGLHLSQIQLVGENIRINLGQVLKGKPLRLLEQVPVTGNVVLKEDCLKASLPSPLLSNALTELLDKLVTPSLASVPTETQDAVRTVLEQPITWEKVIIEMSRLTIEGTCSDAVSNLMPVIIHTSLHLASSHELLLDPLQIQMLPHLPTINLDGFKLDLGSEVTLSELTLTPGQIVCSISLRVTP